MARKYSVTSGLTSLAAATTKVAIQLATSSTVSNTIIAADISFDSTATGAGIIPVRCQIVRTTGASSGGTTATFVPWLKGDEAARTTARINDTTDGSAPSVIYERLISPTTGLIEQLPLGRDFPMTQSDFVEVRLISQAGMTTCNYVANFTIEE